MSRKENKKPTDSPPGRAKPTESQADMAVCTQKDLVKLNVERLGEMPLYALAIELEVTSGLDQLESKLESILALVNRE